MCVFWIEMKIIFGCSKATGLNSIIFYSSRFYSSFALVQIVCIFHFISKSAVRETCDRMSWKLFACTVAIVLQIICIAKSQLEVVISRRFCRNSGFCGFIILKISTQRLSVHPSHLTCIAYFLSAKQFFWEKLWSS